MANFTPQQIEDFLQEFFDVVGARQYIGARYVPIFGRAGEDTVKWDNLAPYEPLTVVMHEVVSYVSRRYVPTGIQITDTDYWVETYRFNAQVEEYRQEVLSFQGQIDQIREDMESDFVPFPDPDHYPKYGTTGQVLGTLTDGTTIWQDPVVPSDEQAEEVITQWLSDHPEATTTVQDNSLTTAKYQDGSVTDAKLAQSGGILSRVSDLTSELEQDELSAFTKDGAILHIPKYRIPYQSGTRYISKQFFIPVVANHEYYISIGNIENGHSVRVSYTDSSKAEISQTATSYTNALSLQRKDSPNDAAYMKVMLYAVAQTYAENDGVAVFTDVSVYSAYGKAFETEANKGINTNGLKIDYNGRSLAWFFKDEINVYRDVSSQYAAAYIYDAPDFSSYTGVSVTIPNRALTNVKGKYILLYFTGASYDSVRVDYTEQVQTDASELNFLINVDKDKYSRFFWFTDSHADYSNPIITDGLNRAKNDAKFIADNVLMDFVLHSGDIVAQSLNDKIGSKNGIRFMSKELKGFSEIGKLIYAVGNHDGLNINEDYITTTLYSIGYDYEKQGNQYYYFDNPGLGVRFVVLAIPDDNQYGPDKPQLDWLSQVALDTNYNVVVITHITPVSDMYNAQPLADIMRDFNDKTSGSGQTYWGSEGKPSEQLEPWDFSNGTGGKVMVVLGGHTHRDIVLAPNELDTVSGRTNPFPCYLVQLRNTFYDASHGDVAYSDKSYAYDVAVLNLTTGYLSLHRRGNGLDRNVPLTMQ